MQGQPLRIQMKEFDWLTWDYNMFGKYVYTYHHAPSPISFYFKDTFTVKWGQGDADIFVNGKLFRSVAKAAGPEDEAILLEIVHDPEEKYSLVEFRVKRGPVVIDEASFMEQFITRQNLSSDITGSKILAGSFRIEVKK